MNRQCLSIFEKLSQFVEAEVPAPRLSILSQQTELSRDLKMAEEDAEDFLAKWFVSNNIAIGDFQFPRYFPSEGFWLLPRLRKSAKPVPVSLGMLGLAAEMHRWDSGILEQAYLRNCYEMEAGCPMGVLR